MQNYIYSLIAFIVFSLNICTIVSVACMLQQRERGKCFDQTLLLYDPVSAYTQSSYFQPWTQDLMQGYCWVNWVSAVNQATEVYLLLVELVHWRPSKTSRAHAHVSKNYGREISEQRGTMWKGTSYRL
jgi:hypothetical protein